MLTSCFSGSRSAVCGSSAAGLANHSALSRLGWRSTAPSKPSPVPSYEVITVGRIFSIAWTSTPTHAHHRADDFRVGTPITFVGDPHTKAQAPLA
ncbi:hypothetical protein IG631_23432 [Alternaria alternata]|nr:hypothetical protein IG631_23432 [Alternaria alternata]